MPSLNTNNLRDSEITKKPIETRLAELETLLLPFKNFSSNQLYEMYDEYCRRQLATTASGSYYIAQATASTSTGDQVITGVGFTPSYIRIRALKDGEGGGFCEGGYDGTRQRSQDFYIYSTGYDGGNNEQIIHLHTTSGTSLATATITAIGSDGFTLNWTVATTNILLQYECFA